MFLMAGSRGAVRRVNRAALALTLAAVVFFAFLLSPPPARAEDWPQWRGPRGDGTSTEKNLPVTWSATENVVWRVKPTGTGASTPVIWGDRVFLTSQTGQNSRVNDFGAATTKDVPVSDEPIRLFASCRSAADGRLFWENEIKIGAPAATHRKHNNASPSCATDGELTFAWFGSGVVACFNNDGAVVWERDLAAEYGAFQVQYGHASSPVIHGDRLILLCDHTSNAYVLAVDKKTGRNVWKIDRPGQQVSYATPLVVRAGASSPGAPAAPGAREELIIATAGRVEALNPATGAPMWLANGLRAIVASLPIYADGVVYVYGGWDNGPMMAVRAGGEGDVTASRVLWTRPTGGANVPSPVPADGAFFFINDQGIGNCVDMKTGETLWKARVGGSFNSSPVLADGRIYQTSDDGETIVFEPSRAELKILARNSFEEPALASPAVSGGRLFLRTRESLFCLAAPKP